MVSDILFNLNKTANSHLSRRYLQHWWLTHWLFLFYIKKQKEKILWFFAESDFKKQINIRKTTKVVKCTVFECVLLCEMNIVYNTIPFLTPLQTDAATWALHTSNWSSPHCVNVFELRTSLAKLVETLLGAKGLSCKKKKGSNFQNRQHTLVCWNNNIIYLSIVLILRFYYLPNYG